MLSSSSSFMMTSFCFIVLVLISFSISPSLSLSSNPISTIAAAPAFLPDSPLPSPTSNLSPDITPLFPSPKGISPSPTEDSSLPTIPSTPSPPNPDEMVSYGPDSALPPSAQMPAMASEASSVHLAAGSLNLSGLVSLVVICLVSAFW